MRISVSSGILWYMANLLVLALALLISRKHAYHLPLPRLRTGMHLQRTLGPTKYASQHVFLVH